ncbi:MAG: hypothetical protein EPO32_02660 [Anaerolineae bacterium]|nr:MAG: hypothetical protein EPO32_02660 [Anaerolineae bacterium]
MIPLDVPESNSGPRDLLEEARQVPVSAILATLAEQDASLSTIQLIRLSLLDAGERTHLLSAISSLSESRRLEVYEDLADLMETNLLVEFQPFFEQGLFDTNSSIRRISVRGLVECEDERIIPSLLGLLAKDDVIEVQAEAAASLGGWVYLSELDELDPDLSQEVLAALLDAHCDSGRHQLVRRRALESLGYSSDPQVEPLITQAIQAEDENWHASALLAMGRSGLERWNTPVLDSLDHSNNEIRIQAARAAGELYLDDAAPALMHLLEDDDQEIRMAAAWALSEIGGEGASEALNSVLDRTEDDVEIEWIQGALDNLLFNQGMQDFDILDLEAGEGEDFDIDSVDE